MKTNLFIWYILIRLKWKSNEGFKMIAFNVYIYISI